MGKFRYNNENERCKRINRMYLIALGIMFGVFILYLKLLVKSGDMADSTSSTIIWIWLVAFAADIGIYIKDKSNRFMRHICSAEVGVAFVYFMMNTEANFLGLALVGALGVSVLYFDIKGYVITFLVYAMLYIGTQMARVSSGVVESNANGICQVLMTFAVFIMLFVICRLSKLFSDHALGAVEEQGKIQARIMEVVKRESSVSTENVASLLEASQSIAESMQDISYSTERFVENIGEQTYMTQNIQDAILDTQDCASKMVSIATTSSEEIETNQELMEKLKAQSVQISEINHQVTGAMEGLQKGVKDVAEIVTMIMKISKQTSILSLNASVESARAGDAGKGFAVVAEQIRQLAEETREATESITEIIEELDTNAKEVMEATKVSVEATGSQSEMIGTTADAFEELRKSMDMLIGNIQEIDTRVGNLSKANNQIVGNITQLSALSQEVSASAEQTNELTVRNLEYAKQTGKSIQTIKDSTLGSEEE